MDKFTLEQLAWFDRCIFPDDMMDDLIELGMNFSMAFAINCYIKERDNLVSIVQIYQAYGINGGQAEYLNKLVSNFLKK